MLELFAHFERFDFFVRCALCGARGALVHIAMVLLHSATTPNLPSLPPIGPLGGPLGPVALGLGPGDRSLLPHQQRRAKHMQTVACQTDTKELVELRVLQESLSAVRDQLTTVSAELGHTERRLRSEVREEYDERMRTFERRTKEKVKYMKQKQEQSVTTMRKALNAQLGIVKLQQEAELRQEADRHAEQVAAEAVSLRAQLEQQELRIAAHVRENAELREQMERRGTAAPTPAKCGFDDGSEAKVAQLEAQLASRDATIKALREQLSKLMGTTPPAETPPTPSKAKGK